MILSFASAIKQPQTIEKQGSSSNHAQDNNLLIKTYDDTARRLNMANPPGAAARRGDRLFLSKAALIIRV
jgi:hypothetical protein